MASSPRPQASPGDEEPQRMEEEPHGMEEAPWRVHLKEISSRLESKAELSQFEAVRSELSALQERIRGLEAELSHARLQPSPEQTGAGEPQNSEVVKADVENPSEHALPEEALDDEDPREYALAESVWDSLLVCGLATYPAESFMVALGWLASIVIQVYFCVIVGNHLSQPVLDPKKVRDLAIWRQDGVNLHLAYYESYFEEVQKQLLDGWRLDRHDGFVWVGEEAFVRILSTSYLEATEVWPLVTNVSLGKWAKASATRMQDAPDVCGLVTFVYKAFNLDLCDTSSSSIFGGRVGSIRGMCWKTCGDCDDSEGAPPYKNTSWGSLVEWMHEALDERVLGNTSDVAECSYYGQPASSESWVDTWCQRLGNLNPLRTHVRA